MLVTIIKGQSDDKITICRADGTTAAAQFPKKGPVPHDAVHLIVEEVLGLAPGVWGMIAAGHDPEDMRDDWASAALGHQIEHRWALA